VGAQGPQGLQGEAGPQGPQGIQGDVGPQGPAGRSAFEVWQSLPGNETRTIEEFYASLTGAQGEVGPQGPQGAEGPQGLQGPNGLSAFEVWQSLPGNETRTIEEFYASLVGATGPQGPQGEVGPQGPQGEVGPQGPQGPAGLDVIEASPIINTVTRNTPMSSKETLTSVAVCPTGTVLVGGGGRVLPIEGTDATHIAMNESFPSSKTSWTVIGLANNNLKGMTVQSFAVCTVH
jgi:hypothetical protein